MGNRRGSGDRPGSFLFRALSQDGHSIHCPGQMNVHVRMQTQKNSARRKAEFFFQVGQDSRIRAKIMRPALV